MDDKHTVFSDGRYRWYYELNLFTNPTAFITLIKVFGGVIVFCGLLIGLLIQEDFAYTVRFILLFWLYGFGGFLVIGGLSYCIYAAIQGGKYCVVFEMDKKGVTHTQVAKQFQKAQVLAALTTLAGAAKGSLSLMGTGILAGSHSSMKTDFRYVSRVKARRRRNVIYLKQGFSWNQVYVQTDDFESVLDFVLSHIPETAKRRGAARR